MNDIYIIFEFDTYDGDTVIHGVEIGKDKAIHSAKKVLKEVHRVYNRDKVYINKVDVISEIKFDLSSYTSHKHLDGAEIIYLPTYKYERLLFDIAIAESLSLCDAIEDEIIGDYMSEEISESEHKELLDILSAKIQNIKSKTKKLEL